VTWNPPLLLIGLGLAITIAIASLVRHRRSKRATASSG
jgi:hypothetical protein